MEYGPLGTRESAFCCGGGDPLAISALAIIKASGKVGLLVLCAKLL